MTGIFGISGNRPVALIGASPGGFAGFAAN